MKKTKLTRSLLAACSIVALTAVMYGCVHDGSDAPVSTVTLDEVQAGATYTDETIHPADDLVAAIEAAPAADVAAAAGTHMTGDMITLAGLDFECVNGPCSVTVNDDDTVSIMGTIMVMEHMVAMPEPTGPTTADLFAAAQDARDDATTAGTKATDAVKTATDAAKLLGVIEAAGESKTVFDSATAILKAREDAGDAVTEAEAAKTAADNAKTAAEALDDSNEHKTALIAALNAAIGVAEAQIEDATDARDGDALKGAVTAVTGGEDADPQMTPGSHARAVAMMVGEALGGMTVDADIPRGSVDADPADTVTEAVVKKDNRAGMTWAQLVGDDNIRHERIGTDNAVLMLTSVAGMDAADVNANLSATGGGDGDGKYADVFTSVDSNYKGIVGDVWCLGADCEVTSDGKLKGGWYFTPDSTTQTYIPNPDAAGEPSMAYAAETGFAEYGYWMLMVDTDIDTDTDPDSLQLNRYASLNDGATAVTAGLSYAKADNSPDSATYNGEAVGMSVHKEVDVDNVVTSIDSGAFTADVELELRFGDGDDITLGGMIDNFQGNAMDSAWEVELERKILPNAGTFADGKTVASGRNGVWSASAYGTAADQRPIGVFGTFNAHFSDGHAAGAYEAD